ncbi:T9SS type A sorting domain-containing protein [Mariniflexile sp. AS56]|uniref:T9SS type A sorting domain-containing protein n=1 Tax=Mariniflexile sp. AS56 TaxID=3063957 RepID=UPI0026EF6D41|nr:T9SS type A sorting domain-containing protein [Mariniflexile sp. AS56]MDO7173160.1 T9SS type A sorting domain-containing protein [Mariniflexile sp. AS56]
MKLKLHFFMLQMLLSTSVSFSQTLPADITFFNPTMGSGTQTISPSAGTGDDTQIFIDAIDALTTSGGIITVQAGTYRILEVPLKSNVHMEVDAGAIFIPFNPIQGVNNAMFNADANAGIDNFSIVGIGGKFNVDLSELASILRIRVINFKYCSNFKIANFHITDSYTEFSSLAFGSNYKTSNGVINMVRGVPQGGIIENLTMDNGHYGYGLVQLQAGKNILFRDLTCVGGVALRLETGFDLIQYTAGAIFEAIKLSNIYGRNIECTNGQSALQLSPHTLDQGFFDIRDITGTSCEAAVVWSAGFTTDEQAIDGLTPGSFDSASIVRNVTANFGQDAQLHPSKRLRYIPCQLRVERSNGVGISTTLNTDGESRTGPAIGAVLSEQDKPGHYPIDLPVSEVTANGYNIESYYLPPNAFFKDSFDDYEICNESVSGVNFFVPSEYRNTPNPRNPLENGSLSTKNFEFKESLIYPNPTLGKLNIHLSKINNIQQILIYDVFGKERFKSELNASAETITLNLTHLKSGVYFVRIDNENIKKLVIK